MFRLLPQHDKIPCVIARGASLAAINRLERPTRLNAAFLVDARRFALLNHPTCKTCAATTERRWVVVVVVAAHMHHERVILELIKRLDFG